VLKKWLCGFVCLMVLLSALPMECVVGASDAVPGEGSWGRPYVVTDAEQLTAVLGASGSETVYIRLGADIVTDERQTMNVANVLNAVAVQGKKSLDLCGYKVPLSRERHGIRCTSITRKRTVCFPPGWAPI